MYKIFLFSLKKESTEYISCLPELNFLLIDEKWDKISLDKSFVFSIIGDIELLFITKDKYFKTRESFERRNSVL
jgi:hypothetical protein